MRNSVGRYFFTIGVAVIAIQLLSSNAFAVSDVSGWVGSNNTASALAPVNNYTVQSATSVGGTFQDVVPVGPGGVNFADFELRDDSLDAPGGVLSFSNELHMTGTMTISNPNGTLPNLCLCWYDKEATTHRIGLGIANSTTAPFTFLVDKVRIDLGFATTTATNPSPPPATFGNYFAFVSADGTNQEYNNNSVLPSGTYPFTFDYVPGTGNTPGGTMTATVGSFFHATTPIGQLNFPGGDYNQNQNVDAGDYVQWRKGGPLAGNEVDNPGTNDAGDYAPWRARYGNLATGTGSKPWFTDFFEFDSFGFVQRTRTNPPGQGVGYGLTISNITYTGGTTVPGSGSGFGAGAVPEPTTAALALLFSLAAVALRRGCR